MLTPEDISKGIEFSKDGTPFHTKFADESRGVPPDNGGNYGDLIYR